MMKGDEGSGAELLASLSSSEVSDSGPAGLEGR